MDYPRRERLKILGHARVLDARGDAGSRSPTHPDARSARQNRAPVPDPVVSFDWNCPQYITPRYTEAEVQVAVAPLRQRIADLEAITASA